MNWLGQMVVRHIKVTDHVLDLGCGILGPFAGKRVGKTHLCVDGYPPYLNALAGTGPTMYGLLPGITGNFLPNSYDIVLLLDVIEHLDKHMALNVIDAVRHIARREVIIFTPQGYEEGGCIDAWGLGENHLQRHRCGFSIIELEELGFAVSPVSHRPHADRLKSDGLFGVYTKSEL